MDLKFLELTITNFKCFLGSHTFKLSRQAGLYYISGDNKAAPELGANGVGKSSLFDALTWVLFGKTGRSNRPADTIVPWGQPDAKVRVALDFISMKREYCLVRTRNPNGLELIYKDSVREITQDEVESLIGMSEEIFRRSVILAQFGTLFMDLRPEEQSKMFSEALNLEVWLKASTAASAKRKEAGKRLEVVQSEIAELKGRKAQTVESLNEAKQSAANYEAESKRELKKAQTALSKLREELEELISSTMARQGLAAQKKGSGLPGLDLQLKACWKAWRAIGQDKTNALSSRSKLYAKADDLQNRVKQYEETLAKDQTCPSCGQKVPIEHLRKELKQAVEEGLELSPKLTDLQLEIEHYTKELKDWDTTIDALERAKGKGLKLENEICYIEKQAKQLETAGNPHEITVGSLREKIKRQKQRLAELEEQDVTLQQEIEGCTFWQEAFKEIRLNLIDDVLTELDMAVTRHAEGLGLNGWRIKFQTERITQSGNVSLSFTVLLYPPDQEEPVQFASYSGGESQRWQLAIAFGLSEIVLARAGVNPSIEVYDEPTKGLSTEGVENLLEHLSQRAEELERCIYLVEHHSLERGMFAKQFTVQRDETGSKILEDVPPKPTFKRKPMGKLERLAEQANIEAQKLYFKNEGQRFDFK